MSNIIQNLKIMVENDQDEMIDIDQNDDLIGINKISTNVLQDNTKVIDQEPGEENETEFHVNLDKVPSSLKNTVLVFIIKYKLVYLYVINLQKN